MIMYNVLPAGLNLDSEDDDDDDDMSDKIKNPNNLQSGKWQLGLQGNINRLSPALFLFLFLFPGTLHSVWSTAMSFDLYAKYGNNRTLSLVSPKKPYYQWRLRVPSGHVVRLDVVTLQGATPGSCSANKLSAYDFLLPLQNKIIARCVWVFIENHIKKMLSYKINMLHINHLISFIHLYPIG